MIMGCLVELIFTAKVDDQAKQTKFYRRHRRLFGNSEVMLDDKTDGDRMRNRVYVVPGVEKTSKYIHEFLNRDDRLLSVKILS